jgi:hypothetical protein
MGMLSFEERRYLVERLIRRVVLDGRAVEVEVVVPVPAPAEMLTPTGWKRGRSPVVPATVRS